MRQAQYDTRLEFTTLLILAGVNGIIGLDRLAVNFLSPYFIKQMELSNTQLGLFSSALSAAIAATGILIAAAADRSGKQKKILVGMLIAFSLLSAGAGLATSFATLFAARLLLGMAEGPLAPLTLTMMAAASHPKRRGFNLGTMQITGAFAVGAMLGPPLMVALAERFGWQKAFFASAVPGLILALLVARFIRFSPPKPAEATGEPMPSVSSLLKSRNLCLSMAIAALFTAWVTVQNVFMPRYLTETLGFTPVEMGSILGIMGFGGLLGGAFFPALSDRLGRKKMVVIAGFASVATPLIVLYAPHSVAALGWMLAASWLTLGCAPLVCAIIPSESVPPVRTATAVALSMCTAELIGGVLTPPLAGWAADNWGLRAPFWFDIALAAACGLLALALKESLQARAA